MGLLYQLLGLVNQGLHYLVYVVDFIVAVPMFSVAGRLKINAPAASKMFMLAGVMLIARALIEPFLFIFNYISIHLGSQLIDMFMFETVRFYLPDFLVLAAAFMVGSGVQKLIAPPQNIARPNMMQR